MIQNLYGWDGFHKINQRVLRLYILRNFVQNNCDFYNHNWLSYLKIILNQFK